MERQIHGFNFEQYCFDAYGIEPSGGYTDKWDGTLNGLPVSIKCIKSNGAIDLADIFRQASITEDFYMIVGFHDGDGEVNEIHTLLVKGNEYHQLFMENFEEDFRGFLASVSNDASDDAVWKKGMNQRKALWAANTPNIVRPNFKRDHKSQKRVQCSIPNKVFRNDFAPKYEVEL